MEIYPRHNEGSMKATLHKALTKRQTLQTQSECETKLNFANSTLQFFFTNTIEFQFIY